MKAFELFESENKGKTLWRRVAVVIKSGGCIKMSKRVHTDKISYRLYDVSGSVIIFVPERTFKTLLKHRRIMRCNDTGSYVKNPVWRKVRIDKKRRTAAKEKSDNQLDIFSMIQKKKKHGRNSK